MIENQPNTADYNDVITSFYATSSRLNQFEIDQLELREDGGGEA